MRYAGPLRDGQGVHIGADQHGRPVAIAIDADNTIATNAVPHDAIVAHGLGLGPFVAEAGGHFKAETRQLIRHDGRRPDLLE